MTHTDIILWKNDGTVLKKEGCCRGDLLLEADDYIYAITGYSVYKLDCNLKEEEIWDSYHTSEPVMFRMGAVEYFNRKLSWYRFRENVHLFSGSSWSYRKYTEGDSGYSTDSTGIYAPKLATFENDILVGVFTKNYRLLQKEIWSIDNKHKICDFHRDLTKGTHPGTGYSNS